MVEVLRPDMPGEQAIVLAGAANLAAGMDGFSAESEELSEACVSASEEMSAASTLSTEDTAGILEGTSYASSGFESSEDEEGQGTSPGSPSVSVDDQEDLSFGREVLQRGLGDYGCTHYRRRCKIRAPCCGEVFDCRHCHNEIKNSETVEPGLRHNLPRHDVASVICSLCEMEQPVAEVCNSCGVRFGEYSCMICKFFDDDTSKKQYHCEECGICRIGGKENFFHCKTCGCCYSTSLQSGHKCVEKSMHHNCPVCFEFLFDSLQDITVMRCGHTIHTECLMEMQNHSQYACPICSKSVYDMTEVWRQLDMEVAATPMPPEYHDKMVWILCNDCGERNEVVFHVLAQKCPGCSSYNTRQTQHGPRSQSLDAGGP